MKEQTIIAGRSVWFSVCAESDCLAVLLGPYFTREGAEKESATVCNNAHFIIPKAIEWMSVNWLDSAVYEAERFNLVDEVSHWVIEHCRAFEVHPNRSVNMSIVYGQMHSPNRMPSGCINTQKALRDAMLVE